MKSSIKLYDREITVIHKKTTLSTNTDALRLPQNTLVVADTQTGGKGRMGRSFVSNPGGVYMSLCLKTERPAEFITTAAAVAAARAIEEQSGKRIMIKWVNDLYLNDKKICGILASAKSSRGKTEKTALGIGVNLIENIPFDKELSKKAGYVYKSGDFEALRQDFIARFLSGFFPLLAGDGAKIIKEEYERRDYLFGKTVCFIKDGIMTEGIADGFDDRLDLRVKLQGKTLLLGNGEVSLISFD